MAKKKQPTKTVSKYTDPDLRDRLKRKIKAADKGGKKGKWSARKAQLLVTQYEKRGGGYTRPKVKAQRPIAAVLPPSVAAPAPPKAAAPAPPKTAAPAPPKTAAREPLGGFDTMTVATARAAIDGLTKARLQAVFDYEATHKNRSTLLAAVAALLNR